MCPLKRAQSQTNPPVKKVRELSLSPRLRSLVEMKKNCISDAKTQLSSLIKAVEKGESFAITRKDRPIALLILLDQNSPSRGLDTVNEIRNLRTEIKPRITLDEIFQNRDEGRQ